jgi:outer membrane protein assembly factor BamB
MADMAAAAAELARGTRRKALLPLVHRPAEMAWLRRGDDVLISYYETGSSPDIVTLDRPVPMDALLEQCTKAALEFAEATSDPTARQINRRLAERALRSNVDTGYQIPEDYVRRSGGDEEAPESAPGLAFGFEADILPGSSSPHVGSSQADIHALLFRGRLWAFVRGKKLRISDGPILMVAQRMLVAARALVDAWEGDRPANVRLRAGRFQIQVRLERTQEVSVQLGHDSFGSATATAMSVSDAALPILKLVGDIIRTLISVDRAQSRNLRVRSIREEIRAIRRTVRERARNDSFINTDPDRLRPEPTKRSLPALSPPPADLVPRESSLRFSERWSIDVEGLDANATFFCGDRLVLATPSHTLALDRDNGEILWARSGAQTQCLMSGTTLLRIDPTGVVELCSVQDGEPYAYSRIQAGKGAGVTGMYLGGGDIPPMAVLREAAGRVVALDLRTGQPRWKFASRGRASSRLVRAGRVVLATSGDGAINAIDAVSGEVVWRYAGQSRVKLTPVICDDVVIAVSGNARSRRCTLVGIDLFSGELRWSHELDMAASSAPVRAGNLGILAVGGSRDGQLAGFHVEDGSLAWMIPDPGVGAGGACLALDDQLVINSPNGNISSLHMQSGSVGWERTLADPMSDDTPRRLEPVLRGGALYVPSSSVHVLRPRDGSQLGTPMPCDLVPDLIRIDERGWAFVAEESGLLAAYAPVPHLKLIRGGAR